MTGTMDMSQLMNIQNMMENMYNEQEAEKPRSTVLSCYGCEHMCATPISCNHPSGMAVRWDPIRNKSYRVPSFEICVEQGGMCKFFEPDEIRGAGGFIKKKHKTKVKKIDRVLDQLDDDSVPIEEFLENLSELDAELNKEEEGVTDDDKEDK